DGLWHRQTTVASSSHILTRSVGMSALPETAAQRWARWKASRSSKETHSNRPLTQREKRRKAQRASVEARRRNRRLRMQTLSMESVHTKNLQQEGCLMIEQRLTSNTLATSSPTHTHVAHVGALALNQPSIATI